MTRAYVLLENCILNVYVSSNCHSMVIHVVDLPKDEYCYYLYHLHYLRHDVSNSHVGPAVKVIMKSCVAVNDADKHLSNLKVIKYIYVHFFFFKGVSRWLGAPSNLLLIFSLLPLFSLSFF